MIPNGEHTHQPKVGDRTGRAEPAPLKCDGGGRPPLGDANPDRRIFFKYLFRSCLALGSFAVGVPRSAHSAALTKEKRDQLTPDQILAMAKAGNERFRTGKMQAPDYLGQKSE